MKHKVALLIYCDEYTGLSRLKYTRFDAIDLDSALKSFGYTTSIISNFCENDITHILDIIDSFLEKPIDEFVFYYSGHGGEEKGESYLCHVDFNSLANSNEILRYSLKISEILKKISCIQGNKVIIFDACRVSSGKGASANSIPIQDYPENSIICFASSPNQASLEDDESRHGFYTDALLDYIGIPNLQVELLLKQVAQTVAAKTNKKQIPWYHSSLLNEFYFNEETITTFAYSKDAISDSSYRPNPNSKVAWIINDLKTHDFENQNKAIDSFIKWGNYDDISKDDLFVLGRNICQSASGDGYYHSFSAQRFIENFNSFNAPTEIKKHILNGIAFEMYFDHNGSLRRRFKASCCDSIITLLEQPRFTDSRIFIRSNLISQKRLVYLPGSGLLTVEVILSEGKENNVVSIRYKGKLLERFNDDLPVRELDMKRFKNEIGIAICAPSNALELLLNKEVTADTIVNSAFIERLNIPDN